MASSSSGSSVRKPSPVPSAASTRSTEAPIIATPAAAIEKTPDDTSKLRTFLSILRKFIGVADIASVRFSLPAQLLEPTPNLEYWNYLDRPETFIRLALPAYAQATSLTSGSSIGDADDDLGRMLGVLRFWFTKDLKYVKGKPCKPYNSTLGEFFRCDWMVYDKVEPVLGLRGKLLGESRNGAEEKPVKVSYLTEQTSHHPPVSAFYVDCPAKGISARGFDQLSAKFTGTGIRVTPGAHNLGIFITLANRDNEEYQLTHPAANLGGLLRGTLSVTVSDTCFVLCPNTRLKVILHYLEEGWVGKSQNKVVGVIFRYDPSNDNRIRLKDVPEKEILARIEGCWQDQVYYTLANSKEPQILVDLNPLTPVPKLIPPISEQLPNESRRFWADVTQAILDKQYSHATKLKQDLEEKQRQKASARQAQNEEWKPRFFVGALTPVGRPDLTEEGKQALQGMQQGNYHLDESLTTGA